METDEYGARAATTAPVSFQAARTGTAEATWGQRTTWEDVEFFLPQPQWWFAIERRVDVPQTLDLDEALGAVARLLTRHEALRTCLEVRDGRLTQWVVSDGALEVQLVEAGPESLGDLLDRHRRTAMNHLFDHRVDLPVRVTAGLRGGKPIVLVLSVAHVVADVQAMNLLAADLGALLAALAEGSPEPALRAGMQPLDVAALEQSEAGRRLDAAALDHLQRQLDVIAPSMFADPCPVPSPRYRTAVLDSYAAPLALRILAERYRVGTSAVLLATIAALVRPMTETPFFSTGLICGNRAEPQLRRAVGNLSQTVLATFEVADGPFGGLAAAAGDAMFAAYRHARFDPSSRRGLLSRLEAERGTAFDLGCRFNDMWAAVPGTRGDGTAFSPDLVAAAAKRSSVFWRDGSDQDKITFFVEASGTVDLLRLELLADTARLSAEEIAAVVNAVDIALVELTRRDASVNEISALSRAEH